MRYRVEGTHGVGGTPGPFELYAPSEAEARRLAEQAGIVITAIIPDPGTTGATATDSAPAARYQVGAERPAQPPAAPVWNRTARNVYRCVLLLTIIGGLGVAILYGLGNENATQVVDLNDPGKLSRPTRLPAAILSLLVCGRIALAVFWPTPGQQRTWGCTQLVLAPALLVLLVVFAAFIFGVTCFLLDAVSGTAYYLGRLVS